MNTHIPTMFLVIILVGAVLSLSVGIVADRAQRDGLLYWSAGLAAHSICYLLFSQHGRVSDFASIVLGNLMLSVALAAFTEGLYEFYRQPPARRLLWSPVGLLGLTLIMLLDKPNLRIVAGSVLLASQTMLALSFMWQRRSQTTGRGKYFLATGLLAVTVMLLLRALGAALGPVSAMTSLTDSNPIQTFTFLGVLMSLMMLSIGFVLMAKDRADETNRILATRDELTGLANRRRLNETLASEWARSTRSGQPLALVMIDIDHFKRYNDHYGHQAGDECLRRVALTLQGGAQRAGDLAARYGGEEFLLILPDTDGTTAHGLADTLRQAVESLGLPHAHSASGTVTISVGVAALTDSCYKDAASLLSAADAALYRAKNGGRNQVQLAPECLTPDQRGQAAPAKLVQLVWRASYESGNPVIDGQHQTLFRDANRLLGAMLGESAAQDPAALADVFIADLARHFQDEEAIIAGAGYAGAADHAQLHRTLLDKATGLATRFRAGAVSLGELFECLAHDIVARHMLIVDREFFPCLGVR
ncbi:MAG: diguanylate cyclase, partial [Rhodoferax sp.]